MTQDARPVMPIPADLMAGDIFVFRDGHTWTFEKYTHFGNAKCNNQEHYVGNTGIGQRSDWDVVEIRRVASTPKAVEVKSPPHAVEHHLADHERRIAALENHQHGYRPGADFTEPPTSLHLPPQQPPAAPQVATDDAAANSLFTYLSQAANSKLSFTSQADDIVLLVRARPDIFIPDILRDNQRLAAIVIDRGTQPTEWAYQQVCAANEKKRGEIADLSAQLDAERQRVKEMEVELAKKQPPPVHTEVKALCELETARARIRSLEANDDPEALNICYLQGRESRNDEVRKLQAELAQARMVDDAMVTRACGMIQLLHPTQSPVGRGVVREALTAALSPVPATSPPEPSIFTFDVAMRKLLEGGKVRRKIWTYGYAIGFDCMTHDGLPQDIWIFSKQSVLATDWEEVLATADAVWAEGV